MEMNKKTYILRLDRINVTCCNALVKDEYHVDLNFNQNFIKSQ